MTRQNFGPNWKTQVKVWINVSGIAFLYMMLDIMIIMILWQIFIVKFFMLPDFIEFKVYGYSFYSVFSDVYFYGFIFWMVLVRGLDDLYKDDGIAKLWKGAVKKISWSIMILLFGLALRYLIKFI